MEKKKEAQLSLDYYSPKPKVAAVLSLQLRTFQSRLHQKFNL